MTAIKLNIPCLVQQHQIDGQSNYYVRPLFRTFPLATHPRFDQAFDICQRELKSQLDNWAYDRNQASHLLWHQFDPEVQHHKIGIQMQLGSKQFSSFFGVFVFQLQGKFFGLIPSLENYLFLLREPNGKDLLQTSTNVIQFLIEQIYKSDPASFDPQNFETPKKEFITSVELEIATRPIPLKFKRNQQFNFASLFGSSSDFDGFIELTKTAVNLNQKYPGKLNRAYYRDELVEQFGKLLFKKSPAPIAIIGPEGSGRHTLLDETLYQYLDQKEEKNTEKRTLWHLDPNRVIAGMSIVGYWERRFEAILKHLSRPGKEPDLLMIDNPLAMLRIGRSKQSSLNLAHLLRPYLENREIPVVFIANSAQWKLIQEKDPALARQFQMIYMPETSADLSARIVLRKRKWLETQYGCQISIPAIRQLIELHRNYFPNQALPGGVLGQLEQIASKHPYGIVDLPEVKEAFQHISGWQDHIFDDSATLEENEIESRLNAELVGQPEAVKALAGAIHLVKSKLNNPGKPYASFLFVGPTGVGKTQAAKVLSRILTGSEKQLVRFDMNEYLDAMAAGRLIGTFQQPEGHLTSKVRFQPFCVLLFDEIEKAHSSVVDLLLQVLDDGRLTDSKGRLVDFTNTFIILTSNLGSREAASRLGFRTGSWDEKAAYQKALGNKFRPEFLNRIDNQVIFRPLEAEEILGIAHLQIRELLSRDGFVRRTTLLNIAPEALEWVAKRGYDPKMGGRALKRQIERDLTHLSADQLVKIPVDNPILFDIDLSDNQLVPKIRTLSFVSPLKEKWVPDTPSENKSTGYYRKLIARVEKLERMIRRQEESQQSAILDINRATENWQYYHFQNQIAERKERLQTLLLGHKDPHFRESPSQAYRFKEYASKNEGSANGNPDFFEKDYLRKLRERHRLGNQRFDSQTTEYLNQFMQVSFLELATENYLNNLVEKLEIIIEPCINDPDDLPVEYLYDQYCKWLEAQEIQYEGDNGRFEIKVEDYGLSEKLIGEAGIHLFYGSYGTAYPVRVRLRTIYGDVSSESKYRVIRIYQRDNNLLDLRTGFSNDYQCTPTEWNLLIYAGIPPENLNSLK